MKKYILPLFAALLCLGCSKDAVQTAPDLARQEVANKIIVGTVFYGATSSPYGDAKVNGQDAVWVDSGETVTFEAFPAAGYELDHWWLYTAQPPLSTDKPVPAREKAQTGKRIFQKKITRENWYEPVFKPINPPTPPPTEPIQLSVSVDPSDARGDFYIDYMDQNDEHQYLLISGESSGETIYVNPYAQIDITGDYKIDDPLGHYTYWVALNGDYIDDGMPYSESYDFDFHYQITIEPEHGLNQVLAVVINKPSFP